MSAWRSFLAILGLGPDEYDRGYRAAIADAQARYSDVTPTFVPGMWRCAKCKLELYASSRRAFEPQPCPNACGPMWRVTEADYRRELHRFVNACWQTPAGWYCVIDGTPILRLQAHAPQDGKLWTAVFRPPTPEQMHAADAERIARVAVRRDPDGGRSA